MSRNGLNGLHVLFAANPCSVQLDDAPGAIDEQIAATWYLAQKTSAATKRAVRSRVTSDRNSFVRHIDA